MNKALSMRFKGNITRIRDGIVRGWAADFEDLSRTVDVELLVDGRPVARAAADVFRRDLGARFHSAHHAFLIAVPQESFDDGLHAIAVRVAGTEHQVGRTLENVRLSRADLPVVEGQVTAFDGRRIFGFARSPSASKPMRVELLLGSEVLGTRLANRAIPGLTSKGNCGFMFDLRSLWRTDMLDRPLQCRVVGTAQPLPGIELAPLRTQVAFQALARARGLLTGSIKIPACMPRSQELQLSFNGKPVERPTWTGVAGSTGEVTRSFKFLDPAPGATGATITVGLTSSGNELARAVADTAAPAPAPTASVGQSAEEQATVNGRLSRWPGPRSIAIRGRRTEVAEGWSFWLRDPDRAVSLSLAESQVRGQSAPGSLRTIGLQSDTAVVCRLEASIAPSDSADWANKELRFFIQRKELSAAGSVSSIRRVSIFLRRGAKLFRGREREQQVAVISSRITIPTDGTYVRLLIPHFEVPTLVQADGDRLLLRFEFDGPLNVLLGAVEVVQAAPQAKSGVALTPPSAASQVASLREWKQSPLRPRSPAPTTSAALEGRTAISFLGGTIGAVNSSESFPPALRNLVATFARLHGPFDTGMLKQNENPFGHADARWLWTHLADDLEPADIWFLNDATLRLRLARSAPADQAADGRTIQAYQVQLSSLTLRECTKQAVPDGEISFIDVRMTNPYLPLLLTINDADGLLLGASLLPFPSLGRGGPHYAELAALMSERAYMTALFDVSFDRLSEMLASPETGRLVEVLDVDLSGATGAEKIFTPWFKDWCTRVMRVSLNAARPQNTQPKSAAHSFLVGELRSGVRAPEARAIGGGRLQLPAHALPAISALSAPRSAASSFTPRTGKFAVAHPVTQMPIWLVALPDLADLLSPLQPCASANEYPVLLPPSAGASKDVGTPAPSQALLLSINFKKPPLPFRDQPTGGIAAGLFPMAPDTQASAVLRKPLSNAERNRLSLSIRITFNGKPDELEATLASIASQTVRKTADIAVILPDDSLEQRPSVEQLLRQFFQREGKVLQNPLLSSIELLNTSVASAWGDYLLLLDHGAVMHDSRTLEILCTLMSNGKVATAGCTLLEDVNVKDGLELQCRSNGYFPGFASAPVAEPAVEGPLGRNTFPVLANRMACTVVRKTIWRQLGGLRESPACPVDVDFGIRAIEAGYVHLNTGTVAVMLNTGSSGKALPTTGQPSTFISMKEALPISYVQELCA